ncbi:hypothetical protein [Okeania sp. KiyG1]|nr:hypothetical protein [Okeania sp. KiyG1]
MNIYRRDTHTIKAPEKLSSCEVLKKDVATPKNFHPINRSILLM